MDQQLERGRAAVRITREILQQQPGLKQELRQLLWRIDQGEAVQIAGIPDAQLRQQLDALFANINLAKTSKGIYAKRPGATACLTLLGPVIAEARAERSNGAGSDQQAAQQSTAHPVEGMQASNGHTIEGNGAVPSAQQEAAEGGRRVVGPAMPPPELLAAAAEAKQAMEDELEEEVDDLIGPAPPELVSELENAGSDDRSKEVIRILRVLDATDGQTDAYAIMGMETDAKASEVKKRYWRLSLLIHPDKCDHPRANDAFNAVNKAAKDLQDTGKRSAIDADREDARLRRLAAEVAAQQERERQWRVARGTATAEDLQGPIRSGPAERDTWMTDLPEARRPNTQPLQVNVTTFSQRGIQERGDTRGWTETPQQKLLRLSAGEAASTRALESAPAPSVSAGAVDAYNQAHRAKTLLEQHKDRLKEEKRNKKKKQKVEEKRKGKPETDKEGWDPSAHPWRPFDREKDLNIGPKTLSKEEMLKKSGTLDSRFAGTPSGQRSFL
ncbi:hypothetical protein WJX75_008702 [Coccomyxa subellipsoidea]|uniref:J domain-containing protein n=1 Tax=Coccomyxa subellipsoidea TaxID=248742 RepID=A0ABR2YNK7_9CHLO